MAKNEIHFYDGSPMWHRFVESELNNINEIDVFSSKDIADSINLILINAGFSNSTVKVDDFDSVNIINIEFGDQFYIGDLIIDGDKNDTIICNNHFIESEYEILIDSILESYKDQGYYFVNLLPQKYTADNNKVNIFMYLQTGPIVEISSVEFSGIKKTDPELLKRYVNISKGETLNLVKIQDSWERLKYLEFVNSKRFPEIIPEPGYNKARVRFDLSETKLLDVEGAGGYIPDDNGSFVGFLDFKLQNYFGSGRTVGLLLDKKEKNRSVQQLLYSQPFFLLGYGRVKFVLSNRDYRDQFYEFSLNGVYDFGIGRNLSARINFGWKNLEPSDELFQSFDVYNTGFGIKMGKIDNQFRQAPQFLLNWEIGYYARRYKFTPGDSISALSNISDTQNKLKVEATYTIFSSTVIYLKTKFEDIKSSEKPLPISEKILFGGRSGPRGYRNDQFSARRLLSFELEPRLYFSSNNYFYPFMDAAYFEYYNIDESENLSKDDDFIYGYGFGFNLNSENRSFNITLAWGEHSPFDQPRLNIVLSNSF
ncbi:MAG: hypothetical protein GY865_18575 [candidate division Zixibacteria bacterium]|nr:hypothetical protein [candidate division Zixibacteria bacterium]